MEKILSLKPKQKTIDEESAAVNETLFESLKSWDFIVSEHPFCMKIQDIQEGHIDQIPDLDIPVIDKRIKNILIELLQNVTKNQAKWYEDKSHFVLQQKNDLLHIEVSNYLKNKITEINENGEEIWVDKREEISARIDAANTMNAEDTVDSYKETLHNKWFTASGWWWLWFLDMARKIRKIDSNIKEVYTYDFIPTNDENISQFLVKIDIPIRKKESKNSEKNVA